MSKFKRTNMAATGPMTTILVADGDLALASGSLVDGTNAFNIANKQLGVLPASDLGTVAQGTFVATGTATIAGAPVVKVVQGTPKSSAIQTVNVWEVSDPGLVESDFIYADAIRSIKTTKYRVPVYGAYGATDLPTPVVSTDYKGFITLNSVRGDRDYSDNDEVVSENVQTPADFSAIGVTDKLDWVLQNMAYKFNTRSKLASLSNSASVQRGNKDYIVLAVNAAGGFGQAIGTITCAGTPTSITVMNDYNSETDLTPVTTTLTADAGLVGALAHLVKDQADRVAAGETITNQITASSTIEVIDLKDAGKGVQAQGTFTVTNNTNIATDTITIGTTALVEGTDFDAGSDDTAAELAVTATNLAQAINDSDEDVVATASGAVVTVTATAYGTDDNTTVWTYTDQGSAGGTISGSGTLAGGAASNINAMIVIGLEQEIAAYSDNIKEVQTTVDLNLGNAFRTSIPKFSKVFPQEALGTGRKWSIENSDRYQLNKHTRQNQPHGEFFSEGYNYIDPTLNYQSTTVEFYDYEESLTQRHQYAKQLTILMPSVATCTTVTQAVTNLATGPAVTTEIEDTTTGASIEAIFGKWLEAAVTADPTINVTPHSAGNIFYG
jgi:hypothetical protein